MSALGDFARLACEPSVVRRALLYAVVVGAILIGINHGDALLAGRIDAPRIWKMGLTLLVPYAVSTLSSVSALRSLAGGRGEPGRNGDEVPPRA